MAQENWDCQQPYLEDVATPNFIILISIIDKIPRTILFFAL